MRKASVDDLIRWPDGTVCYRGNLHEYTYMSDDYEVITDESPEYEMIVAQEFAHDHDSNPRA
jgi:hypothetical protein